MFKVRKFLASVSVAAILASTFVLNTSAATYQFRGDVNNDYYVDEKDANALIDYILETKTSGITLKSGDLNKDGRINVCDLVMMRRILAEYDKQTLFIHGGNKEFKPGQRFIENDKYYGVFQGDGNCVVYTKQGKPVFDTGTCFGDDFRDYRLIFQADGNIVIYATPNYPGASRRDIWNSQTHDRNKDTTKPYELSFDGNGNLLFNGQNGLLWKSSNRRLPTRPLSNEERRRVALERMKKHYMYSTVEKAAVDFIFYFNPFSVAERTEYGTAINKVTDSNGKTKYVIDIDFDNLDRYMGKQREVDQTNGVGPNIDFDNNPAAYVHTHGHQACDLNNYFSIKYYGNDTDGVPDCLLAQRHECDAYLGAPNGDIRVFHHTDPYPTSEYYAGQLIMRNAPH